MIASRFELSTAAVQRHAEKHIPMALAQAAKVSEMASADSLLERVQQLEGRCSRLLDAAEAKASAENAGSRDFLAAASLTRELRGTLELLGKLSGELQPNASVHFHAHPPAAAEPTPGEVARAIGELIRSGGLVPPPALIEAVRDWSAITVTENVESVKVQP